MPHPEIASILFLIQALYVSEGEEARVAPTQPPKAPVTVTITARQASLVLRELRHNLIEPDWLGRQESTHLMTVIGRLEAALETARNTAY